MTTSTLYYDHYDVAIYAERATLASTSTVRGWESLPACLG
jgi:hypothetical protein